MKNKMLAIVSVCLLLGASSMAQGGFHLGIKGGANLYKIDSKSFSEEFKFGYSLGGFAEINFSKKLGIQPEVLWNQYNTQTTSHFSDIYQTSTSELKDVKLDYLSIPILLSYRPSKLISFQAGPQFGILINQDKNLVQNGGEAFKNGDLSLLGGVQLNIGGIRLGGRYAVGLNNINDISNQDEWKNQGFQLYAGFRIL